eukprot:9015591-Pyramimonas_sp.AAC.1
MSQRLRSEWMYLALAKWRPSSIAKKAWAFQVVTQKSPRYCPGQCCKGVWREAGMERAGSSTRSWPSRPSARSSRCLL